MNPSLGLLRFGILYDGLALERWQLRSLEQLAAAPAIHAELLIVSEAALKPSPKRVDAPYESERIPLTEGLAQLPRVLLPQVLQNGVKDPKSDEHPGNLTLARVISAELDFVLSFVDFPCPLELLDVPRYGVWQYKFGDWVRYRGEPAGFWEAYDGETTSAAKLVRLQADPDSVSVLREGFLRTNLLSHVRNRAQLLTRFTHWPVQVCGDIRSEVADHVRGQRRILRSTAPRRAWPGRREIFNYRCRVLARIVRTAFRSLFRHDQWNIGIVDQPIGSFLESGNRAPVRWLPAPKRSELRADPFGVVRDGRLIVLCEHFSYRDNCGFIVALDPAAGASKVRVDIGPQPVVHLSYPYLFEVKGRLLCMPESSEGGEVACYEAQRFPDQWKKVAVLLNGPAVVDATVFCHGNYWWLAGSEVAAKGANCELHLWYADTMNGPWQAHGGNPVKIDVRSSRPAGTPFMKDGILYRPAQDCSGTYGARVIINQIVTLTPHEFEERPVATVDPDPSGPYPDGLHTLSSVGGQTLIDGKRSAFSFAEFRRVVGHLLQAAFRRQTPSPNAADIPAKRGSA